MGRRFGIECLVVNKITDGRLRRGCCEAAPGAGDDGGSVCERFYRDGVPQIMPPERFIRVLSCCLPSDCSARIPLGSRSISPPSLFAGCIDSCLFE